MPRRDIIVIGGSAGSIEVLQKLSRSLPADLPAALFMVVHLPPRSRSNLPEILNQARRLVAAHPLDGEPIAPGRIYVAPPDHHLVVEAGHVHLSTGPKENRQRPSINVTFRTAALAYGERVIGVVLSGELDDGTAGLWEIKRRGGLTVVQHPEDAAFSSMPLSVLREMEVDHTVHVSDMGNLLTHLACEDAVQQKEQETAAMEPKVVDLTCPECRGTIWEVSRSPGGVKEFQCRVGHTYSPQSMFAEHFAAQEKALWAAIVALEEGAVLATKLADILDRDLRERLMEECRQRQTEAEALRRLMQQRKSFSLD